MINCKIIGTRKNPIGFECTGHAGYDEIGYDIVCAGVSALTIACANGLKELAQCPVEVREKDGHLKVTLIPPLTDKQKEQGELLLKVLFLGIEDIAATYPAHVRLVV